MQASKFHEAGNLTFLLMAVVGHDAGGDLARNC
jgi:hypothetical protein